MPATYEPIATITLVSAAASIEFTSIPATYTDLRFVLVFTPTANLRPRSQLNGDTATNYSSIVLVSDGSTLAAASNIDDPSIRVTNSNNSNLSIITYDWLGYTGSTFKSGVATYTGDDNGSGRVTSAVVMHRTTSATTSIKAIVSASTYAAGSTATLYGIKNA
jgi:hypothetical protein